MKKAVAISFLLFANLVLLAHAFVPHHHHEGVPICFSSHEHNCDSGHDHNIGDCTHLSRHIIYTDGHDICPTQQEQDSGYDHRNEDCCRNDCCNISKDVYVRISEDDEIFRLLGLLNCSDSGVEPNFCIISEDIDKLPLAGAYGLPFRQKPYHPSYISDFIIGSFGLRGPPPFFAFL